MNKIARGTHSYYQPVNILEALFDSGRRQPLDILHSICTVKDVRAINLDTLIYDIKYGLSHLIFQEIQNFLVRRRPKFRVLSKASKLEIDQWFDSNQITIGDMAKTAEERGQVKPLLYT